MSRFGLGTDTACAPIFGGMVEQSRGFEVALLLLRAAVGEVVLSPDGCAFVDRNSGNIIKLLLLEWQLLSALC